MPRFIHQQVYDDFVQRIGSLNQDQWLAESSMTQDRFLKLVFVNYAPAYPSLALTHVGFTILKGMYQVWCVPLATDSVHTHISGNVMLTLHRHMKTPYYLDPKNIYVFGSEAALELEMASRDIVTWSKMFG